jgi:hypothetical protein
VPQRAPLSAGSSVLAAAGRFSNALLIEEQTCFETIDRLFEMVVAAAVPKIRDGWRRSGGSVVGLPKDTVLRQELLKVVAGGLTAVRPHVAFLATTAQTMALDAIGAELRLCESTLPPKYAGTAAAAVEAARRGVRDVPTAAMRQFVAQEPRLLDDTDQAVQAQLRAAAEGNESLVRVTARLCSLQLLNWTGNGGMGVLLRPRSSLHAAARNVSIGLSNTAREQAMGQFNAIADRVKSRRAKLV